MDVDDVRDETENGELEDEDSVVDVVPTSSQVATVAAETAAAAAQGDEK